MDFNQLFKTWYISNVPNEQVDYLLNLSVDDSKSSGFYWYNLLSPSKSKTKKAHFKETVTRILSSQREKNEINSTLLIKKLTETPPTEFYRQLSFKYCFINQESNRLNLPVKLEFESNIEIFKKGQELYPNFFYKEELANLLKLKKTFKNHDLKEIIDFVINGSGNFILDKKNEHETGFFLAYINQVSDESLDIKKTPEYLYLKKEIWQHQIVT